MESHSSRYELRSSPLKAPRLPDRPPPSPKKRLALFSSPSVSSFQRNSEYDASSVSVIESAGVVGVARRIAPSPSVVTLAVATPTSLSRVRSSVCLPVTPIAARSSTSTTTQQLLQPTGDFTPIRKDVSVSALRVRRRSPSPCSSRRSGYGSNGGAAPSRGPQQSDHTENTVTRKANSFPPPTSDCSSSCSESEVSFLRPFGLSKNGGGLTRSSGSSRLPSLHELQCADASTPSTSSSSSSTYSCVPHPSAPPLPPRRSTTSTTVTTTTSLPPRSQLPHPPQSLTHHHHHHPPPPSPSRQSRQSRLSTGPSSTNSIRIRPPSPSRAAKAASGLYREYSTSYLPEAGLAVDGSNSIRESSAAPTVPHRDHFVLPGASRSVLPSKQPIASLQRSLQSTSTLRPLRPPSSCLSRSYSTVVIPVTSAQDVTPDASALSSAVCTGASSVSTGPPPSPITRSIKRRLLSESSSSNMDVFAAANRDQQARCHANGETVVNDEDDSSSQVPSLPSASFFLKDVDNDDVAADRNESSSTNVSACSSPATKHARRSKKMRRMEVDRGEVDDEARDMALHSFLSSSSIPSTSLHRRALIITSASLSPQPTECYSNPLRDDPPSMAVCCDEEAAASSTDVHMDTVQQSPVVHRSATFPTMKSVEGEASIEDGVEVSTLRVVSLPPPPAVNAFRKADKEYSSSRQLSFNHVHVFYFERKQGYTAVPSMGEVCLGMEARHYSDEKYSLSETQRGLKAPCDAMTFEEDEEEEVLSEGEVAPDANWKQRLQHAMSAHSHANALGGSESSEEKPPPLPLGDRYTTKFISPLPNKSRSKLLRTSGVKIFKDAILMNEHEAIRRRRRECGCSCVGGVCRVDTCECAKSGVQCQVDDVDRSFPCNCAAESCTNPEGRVEFSPSNVYIHYTMTMKRLADMEKKGGEIYSNSPTHIRFDDGEVSHSASSYLATPPPTAYMTPLVGVNTKPAIDVTDVESMVTTLRNPIVAQLSGEGMFTPPTTRSEESERQGGAHGAHTDNHTKFPVTPVYKRLAPGARMAQLSNAVHATPTLPDNSLDEYATPPQTQEFEKNEMDAPSTCTSSSPTVLSLNPATTTADSSVESPPKRVFPVFPSLAADKAE